MSVRIIDAEVTSFRLEVPRAAIERLPEEVGALPLAVEGGPGEVTLRLKERPCVLTFTVSGRTATLSKVQLENDERGLFFQRVLGPLMVRFGGDLSCKLHWSAESRKAQGDRTDVRIDQGATTYPGLSMTRNVISPESLSGMGAGENPFIGANPGSELRQSALEVEGPELTEEEDEAVTKLLQDAKRAFDTYVRANRKLLP